MQGALVFPTKLSTECLYHSEGSVPHSTLISMMGTFHSANQLKSLVASRNDRRRVSYERENESKRGSRLPYQTNKGGLIAMPADQLTKEC